MSYSTKKYLSFDQIEQRSVAIAVLVCAFILSFKNWGPGNVFDARIGLQHLVLTILLVGISLIAKIVMQKWLGIRVGVHVEYKAWYIGLGLGLLLVFLTKGFPVLLIGGIIYGTIERLRIGREYAVSNKALMWISFVGILTHLALAGFARIMQGIGIFSDTVLNTFVGINLWFALYAILPIPIIHSMHKMGANDGLLILYSSRLAYVAALSMALLSMAFIAFSSLLIGVVVTAVVTALIWFGYYFYVETK